MVVPPLPFSMKQLEIQYTWESTPLEYKPLWIVIFLISMIVYPFMKLKQVIGPILSEFWVKVCKETSQMGQAIFGKYAIYTYCQKQFQLLTTYYKIVQLYLHVFVIFRWSEIMQSKVGPYVLPIYNRLPVLFEKTLKDDAKVLMACWKEMGGKEEDLRNGAGDNVKGWTGITVGEHKADFGVSRVTEVVWKEMGLDGYIPPKIQELSAIKTLDLSKNKLKGHIIPQLGRLTMIEKLDLSENMLGGPPSLDRDQKPIDKSQLYGIPLELSKLSFLLELYVQGNMLSGCLPPEMPPRLCALRIENDPDSTHFLEGNIPTSFAKCKYLLMMGIHGHKFEGPDHIDIPTKLVYDRDDAKNFLWTLGMRTDVLRMLHYGAKVTTHRREDDLSYMGYWESDKTVNPFFAMLGKNANIMLLILSYFDPFHGRLERAWYAHK